VIEERYLLGVGDAGRERMEILNEIYNPSTQEFLLRSGLREGMRVLEIGSGIGEMTDWLARRVGSSGRVVSVDPSAEQLALARGRVDSSASNAEWRQGSVYDLRSDEPFDFIVCRWVLLHLRRPEVAVDVLRRSLAPSGTLALEDCITDSAFCYPGSGSFRRFIEGWLAVSETQGLDPRIGARLPRLLLDAGLRLEQYGVFQPLLVKPDDRRLFSLSLAETRSAHVDAGVLTQEEIERTVADLDRESREPRAMGFVRNHQVAGTKS
jgi:SAM-dependent methyltransferase